MRIAIDGLPLTQPLTGVGHYTSELARHLAFANPEDQVALVSPRRFLTKPQGPKNLSCLCPTINPLRRVWWRTNLASYIKHNNIDLFHGTNFELPTKANCATVVTIHDLSTLLYEGFHEEKNVERANARLPEVAASATLIITPTEAIRLEVQQHLNVPEDRVFAVAEAARECFQPASWDETAEIRGRLKLSDKFVLYVGTVEPRKNLLNLVKAFEEVCEEYPELKLVIAGGKGWMVDDFFDYLKNSAARERIVLPGYLGDQDLRYLYSACTLFFYPSLYEGFGLPPLEAMACGAPVVSSTNPSIEKVVGKAARLITTDTEAMASTMKELLADEDAREALAAAGRRRAAEFSWKETARRTREIYVEAVGRFELGRS